VEEYACSDRIGDAILYSCGGDSRSSLALAALGGINSRASQIRVPVVTLDDYLHQRGLPTPRWVKIDAEGAEIRILKGAPRLLASDAGILCELHPYVWPEMGNTLAELRDLAAAAGRRIRYIDQDGEIGDRADYGTVVLER
jgi:hypothetical protein